MRYMKPLSVAVVVLASCAVAVSGHTPTSGATTTVLVSLIERPIGTEVSTRTTDAGVTSLKSTTSLTERGGKLELIASMEMVDCVVLFDEPDPTALIDAIKPDVLAKGADWNADKVVGADLVEKSGGRVVRIPYLRGFSTSEIIERIVKQHGENM